MSQSIVIYFVISLNFIGSDDDVIYVERSLRYLADLLFENEESSNQEVTVVLVGDNIMNNENANSVGIRLRHGKSTKFTGTGTLVIKNSDFDPAAYTNVTFDGLKATYDKDTNTTTIQPE